VFACSRLADGIAGSSDSTLNSNLEHAIVAPGTTAGTIEPWLKRMQYALIYTF
jgi:hypothetical protein